MNQNNRIPEGNQPTEEQKKAAQYKIEGLANFANQLRGIVNPGESFTVRIPTNGGLQVPGRPTHDVITITRHIHQMNINVQT